MSSSSDVSSLVVSISCAVDSGEGGAESGDDRSKSSCLTASEVAEDVDGAGESALDDGAGVETLEREGPAMDGDSARISERRVLRDAAADDVSEIGRAHV